MHDIIKLKVFHRNLLGKDKFIGFTEIQVDQSHSQNRPLTRWLPLQNKTWKKNSDKYRGEIEVIVAYIVKSLSQNSFSLSKSEKLSLSVKHLASNVGRRFNSRKLQKHRSFMESNLDITRNSLFEKQQERFLSRSTYNVSTLDDRNASIDFIGEITRYKTKAKEIYKNNNSLSNSNIFPIQYHNADEVKDDLTSSQDICVKADLNNKIELNKEVEYCQSNNVVKETDEINEKINFNENKINKIAEVLDNLNNDDDNKKNENKENIIINDDDVIHITNQTILSKSFLDDKNIKKSNKNCILNKDSNLNETITNQVNIDSNIDEIKNKENIDLYNNGKNKESVNFAYNNNFENDEKNRTDSSCHLIINEIVLEEPEKILVRNLYQNTLKEIDKSLNNNSIKKEINEHKNYKEYEELKTIHDDTFLKQLQTYELIEEHKLNDKFEKTEDNKAVNIVLEHDLVDFNKKSNELFNSSFEKINNYSGEINYDKNNMHKMKNDENFSDNEINRNVINVSNEINLNENDINEKLYSQQYKLENTAKALQNKNNIGNDSQIGILNNNKISVIQNTNREILNSNKNIETNFGYNKVVNIDSNVHLNDEEEIKNLKIEYKQNGSESFKMNTHFEISNSSSENEIKSSSNISTESNNKVLSQKENNVTNNINTQIILNEEIIPSLNNEKNNFINSNCLILNNEENVIKQKEIHNPRIINGNGSLPAIPSKNIKSKKNSIKIDLLSDEIFDYKEASYSKNSTNYEDVIFADKLNDGDFIKRCSLGEVELINFTDDKDCFENENLLYCKHENLMENVLKNSLLDNLLMKNSDLESLNYANKNEDYEGNQLQSELSTYFLLDQLNLPTTSKNINYELLLKDWNTIKKDDEETINDENASNEHTLKKIKPIGEEKYFDIEYIHFDELKLNNLNEQIINIGNENKAENADKLFDTKLIDIFDDNIKIISSENRESSITLNNQIHDKNIISIEEKTKNLKSNQFVFHNDAIFNSTQNGISFYSKDVLLNESNSILENSLIVNQKDCNLNNNKINNLIPLIKIENIEEIVNCEKSEKLNNENYYQHINTNEIIFIENNSQQTPSLFIESTISMNHNQICYKSDKAAPSMNNIDTQTDYISMNPNQICYKSVEAVPLINNIETQTDYISMNHNHICYKSDKAEPLMNTIETQTDYFLIIEELECSSDCKNKKLYEELLEEINQLRLIENVSYNQAPCKPPRHLNEDICDVASSNEGLVSVVNDQQRQIKLKDKKIAELEKYIDNLLVRVLEIQPQLLTETSVAESTINSTSKLFSNETPTLSNRSVIPNTTKLKIFDDITKTNKQTPDSSKKTLFNKKFNIQNSLKSFKSAFN